MNNIKLTYKILEYLDKNIDNDILPTKIASCMILSLISYILIREKGKTNILFSLSLLF